MVWAFVGPTPMSGIGQVVMKYADIMKGTYFEFFTPFERNMYSDVFLFALPIPEYMAYFVSLCPTLVMTVCETDPVHEEYGKILDIFKGRVVVPSEFCKRILEKQFPGYKVDVLRHTVKIPRPYTFYTIGNMLDYRKNVSMLLDVFGEHFSGNPDVALVIKSTAREPLNLNIPGVTVINEFLDEKSLGAIHETSHCYINCSYSEGVGMGAVEAAAAYDKPIIITDFGGLAEYIPGTNFILRTTPEEVGRDDFLFQKHMKWAKPSKEDLVRYMKYCYTNRIMSQDHSQTRRLLGSVKEEFLRCMLKAKRT
jgi:glycosyltransferase involved in cell wall biosynthesis